MMESNEITNILKVGDNKAFQKGLSKLNDIYNSNLENYEGLPSDYLQKVLRAIEQRHNIKKYTSNYSEVLIEHTSKLSANSLPSIKWNGLVFLLISNGLFKVAHVARTKGIESATYNSFGESFNNTSIHSLKAFADQGDLKSAKEIIARIKKNDFDKSLLDRWKIFHTILKGDKKQATILCEPNFSKADRTFFNYISGKRVAIVGPAPVKEDFSKEINSFDVVIRFNYKGGLPKNGFGNRIDVSYYNGGTANYLNSNDTYFLNDVKFSCFKSIRYQYQKDKISTQEGRAFFPLPAEFLFSGSPNALPNVLFDILHFNPKYIKVFHCNLYLTNTPHYQGYQLKKREKNSFWQAFAVHELITQFNFLKNIWKVKLFEPDKTLEAVLKLTPEKYMETMEKIYVYPFLMK
ncbi:hypothetical protein [Halobacillus litoralis]|uniref:Uncharacterized protein n=1 Tax=Halobacillus litoralis TaxID=45668 RepID=A0A410MC00_9BACI|nr:hypothetical protein [Halobacillus litoralis]QAS52282.1 hypothetical protein HLI_08575 [Halobacillus litoralis]